MILTPNCQYSQALGSHLRFTVEASRGNLRLARAIQNRLQGVDGVLLVSANFRTGDVLILCEREGINQEQLADKLRPFEHATEAVGQCTN